MAQGFWGWVLATDGIAGSEDDGRPSDDAHISESRYGAPGRSWLGCYEKSPALVGAGLLLWYGLRLVEDLEAELEDARLEGAGDLAASGWVVEAGWCSGGGRGAGRTGGTAAGDVEVCVVEEVVGFGAELDAQTLKRSGEGFVEGYVGLVESRRTTWV